MSPLLQLVEPGTTLDPHQAQQPAVGIDLGTTHSLIAISHNQKVEILCDENGEALLPSVVAYPAEGEVWVGKRAEEALSRAPETVVRSVKRFIGDRPHKHDSALPDTPMHVMSPSPMIRLSAGARQLTPIEISADILRALKDRAEKALGTSVEQAVITVPAFFDEAARAATRDAARLAGLEVLRLLNEPTAAALAYGLEHQAEGLYAVYDLGGGTFDLSLLRLEKGVFQVLATGGDTALGGDDFDQCLLNHIMGLTSKDEISLSPSQIKRGLVAAKKAKEALSSASSTSFILEGLSAPAPLTLTRDNYEALIAPLVDKTLAICADVLLDARLTAEQIKGVILVGGATRTPIVRKKVEEFFLQKPLCTLNPDEAVVWGAALQAEALTTGSQNLLLDVTPLSLGLETMGGLVEKIIPRNTPLPASKSQEFTTYQEGQTGMSLHVVQGEREFAGDCRSLAHFELKGIPPLAAGIARVKVTFTVDADGLLTVTAREQTTGILQHIEVKPSYGLTEEDLCSMLEASYFHGREDVTKRLLEEARLEANRLLHILEKALQTDRALLSAREQEELKAQCATLRLSLETKEREVIQQAIKQLEEAALPFAERRLNHNLSAALKERTVDEVAFLSSHTLP